MARKNETENLEKVVAATSSIQPVTRVNLGGAYQTIWEPFFTEYQANPLMPYLRELVNKTSGVAATLLGLTSAAYGDLLTLWEKKGVLDQARSELEGLLEDKWKQATPGIKATLLTAIHSLMAGK